MEGGGGTPRLFVGRQSIRQRRPVQAVGAVVNGVAGGGSRATADAAREPGLVSREPIVETERVLAAGSAGNAPATPRERSLTPLRGFTKYDRDEPGVAVSADLAAELRRLANLFLLSSLTLVLFLLRAAAVSLGVSFIPAAGYVVWGIVLMTGWAMTYVYAVFVTFKARRWGWFALCAFPLTCVPAGVAYAWIRRGEIEAAVLGRVGPAQRRPGGRGAPR